MKKLRDAVPKQFLERLLILYGNKRLDDILEAFVAARPATFRVNAVKSSASEILSELEKASVSIQPIRFIPGGFELTGSTLRDLQKTNIYTDGKIYVQSQSSMIPVLVLDPRPNENILDLTSAPGSKTTQIASIMNNTGHIIANDNSPNRIHKLRANLKLQGVKSATVTSLPGQILWQTYPEYFDKTLVDVPCSMEGRFSLTNPEESGEWSLKRIQSLSERQKWLLRSGVSATRAGGTIVYATCTLAPEENEEVISWILKKEKGAVELQDIFIKDLPMEDGLISFREKKFGTDMKKTKRIAPTGRMEGFFIAKMKKNRPTVRGILPIAQ